MKTNELVTDNEEEGREQGTHSFFSFSNLNINKYRLTERAMHGHGHMMITQSQ
jgi:hypothetical protein